MANEKNKPAKIQFEEHNPEFAIPTPAKDVFKTPMGQVEIYSEDLIYAGLTLLMAASKTARTRIATYLASCFTSGTLVFGRRATKKVRMLLLALSEDTIRISSRLRDVEILNLYNLELSTTEKYTGMAFLKRLRGYIIKRKVEVVIIDTLKDVMDSNMRGNAKLEYEFIKSLRQLANATGTAIIAIHHSDKLSLERRITHARALEEGADNVILIGKIYHEEPYEYSKILLYGRNFKRSEFYLKTGDDGVTFSELDEKPIMESHDKTLERVRTAMLYGMTQADIALIMGISQPQVSRLMSEITDIEVPDEDILDDIEEFVENEDTEDSISDENPGKEDPEPEDSPDK